MILFKQVDKEFTLTREAPLTKQLPAGIYGIGADLERGLVFKSLTPISDNFLDINGSITDTVLSDIKSFTDAATVERFKKYGIIHKRGILMHGPAGTGKSTTVVRVANFIKDQGAVVLFNPNVELLGHAVSAIRENNPECLIGVIYEELDDWLSQSQATLLSVLDGELQVDNFIVIACTNYINRIPSRIKNRPSRFARVIEVEKPSKEFREAFFAQKLSDEDKHRVAELVDATDGFVIDQMKDLVVSVFCMNTSISEAVMKLKEMEDDSIGMDDWNERQKTELFSELKKDRTSKRPIRPIR